MGEMVHIRTDIYVIFSKQDFVVKNHLKKREGECCELAFNKNILRMQFH